MTSLPPTLLPDSTHAQYNWRASARRRRALPLVLVLGQTLAATRGAAVSRPHLG